jgi:1-pyrroline-5-carboxylate dehydrogenase
MFVPADHHDEAVRIAKGAAESMKVGDPFTPGTNLGPVVSRQQWEKIQRLIQAGIDEGATLVTGGPGRPDGLARGYYVRPTVFANVRNHMIVGREEIFGPVLSIHVYPDRDFDSALRHCDQDSPYALTGAVFARDRLVVDEMTTRLRHSAGNFYVNDKPTGAVVGQQPFGGARASGTNDKAGSWLNLVRWLSPRTIKENFLPPHDWRYPHQDASS